MLDGAIESGLSFFIFLMRSDLMNLCTKLKIKNKQISRTMSKIVILRKKLPRRLMLRFSMELRFLGVEEA